MRLVCTALLVALFFLVIQSPATTRKVPQDFTKIQLAINAAVNGDTVLVSEGTYLENLLINKKIIIGSLFIVDNDTSHISKTILDGSGSVNPDSGSVISVGASTDTTLLITGFTVRGGKGTKTFDTYAQVYWLGGGGIESSVGGGARISHNRIINNVLSVTDTVVNVYAGGIAFSSPNFAQQLAVIIEHNLIADNSVTGNAVEAGGIGLYGYSGRIVGNIIERNKLTSATTYCIGGGMTLGLCDPMIVSNNIIRNNSTQRNGGGIFINGNSTLGSSSTIITNNIFSGNAALNGGGVFAGIKSTVQMINNTFVNNNATNGSGLCANSQSSINIALMNNIFSNTIKTPNQIYSFGGNIWGASNLIDGGPFGDNCITANPQFIDSDPFYGIKPTSPAVGAGAKTKTLGGILMTAPLTDRTGTIRPNPSWSSPDLGATESPFSLPGISTIIRVPQDQSTIQKGINAASTGDLVLVSEGTYKENIVLRKKITLSSFLLIDKDTSHISKTIIDGSTPSHPDTGAVISIKAGTDSNTVITGFTIKGGTGNKHINPSWHPASPTITGGGIEINSGGATIRNNIITQNHITVLAPATDGYGGGIDINDFDFQDSSKFTIIESNTISNNSVAGGTTNGTAGMDLWNVSARIVGNKILGNVCNVTIVAFGGGYTRKKNAVLFERNLVKGNSVDAVSGIATGGAGMTATIRNNVIIDNIAGIDFYSAVWISDTVNAIVEGNYIARNSGFSQHGITLVSGATSLIRNNIIVNNSGAGIIVASPSTATIVNNTIVGNSRHGISGTGTCYLLNNISWNNTLGNLNSNGSRFTAYNLIGGGYAGIGNIDADPKFRPDDSLYHFIGSSPCNSGGVPTASVGGVTLNAPAYDYFGDPRPMPNFPGARPDIGAVEMPLNPNPGEVRDLGIGLPAEFSLSQNYPNPFNPSTTIRYALPSSAHVRLTVYDMLGREVETLFNEEQSAGWKEVEWNAGTHSSGIYFYTIQAGANIETKKLMLLK